MLRISLALAAVVACALLAVLPAAASAGCTSSTANSQTYPDAGGDDQGGLAPDIIGVIMVTGADCTTGGSLAVSDGRDSMIEGESTGMYLDTDGNPATGDTAFRGADRVIITIGHLGADANPGVGVYNAATADFDFGSEASPIDVGLGGWGWSIDQIGFQPVTVGVQTIAMYRGLYDSYSDFSPEVGSPPHGFGVAYGTQTVAPDVPAITQPVDPQKSADEFVCKPGKLRGLKYRLARSKAISRGCDVKVKFRKARAGKAGRVLRISTSKGTVTLVVGRKSGRARSSAAPVSSADELDRLFRTLAAGRKR